jgi:hypothetical protein
MALKNSNKSFCIDSLLAQDEQKTVPAVASSSPAVSSSSPSLSFESAPFRFRSTLFGYPPIPAVCLSPSADPLTSADQAADAKMVESGNSSRNSPEGEAIHWSQQPISRPSAIPASYSLNGSVPTSSASTTAGYTPLFNNPAAALHAAAAAAAAASGTSPAAQFHSAHLEWLARAGVLYHRFGADLSGEFHGTPGTFVHQNFI